MTRCSNGTAFRAMAQNATIAASLVFGASIAPTAIAQTKSWPTKPIRMIVAVPPGGPADTIARLVGPRLTESLGEMVVIDNRPGANGNIAYETTARAAADGYTVVTVAAGVAINPSLYAVKYDPVKDFAPITLGITVPNILVIHPAVPAASLKELVALAKSRPGKLTFASAGTGTSGHLALELFRAAAELDVIHVPYKGGGPALTELLGGQVQALFSIALTAMPQVKAGKVKALAITSAKRSAVAPELPTVAELGYPGFEVVGWFGWLAPAATPRDILARLNAEIVRILNDPAMKERLVAQGADPAPTTQQQFAEFIRSEHIKWAKVVKDAKIRME